MASRKKRKKIVHGRYCQAVKILLAPVLCEPLERSQVTMFFFSCSLRTSTLNYIASAMATVWTTMRGRGRRRVVRSMSAPTKPGRWLAWRPNCTTNRDTPRRYRWRKREYAHPWHFSVSGWEEIGGKSVDQSEECNMNPRWEIWVLKQQN